MKFTRTLAMIAGTTLALAACDQASVDATATVKENTNQLLAHVPADTAYVFAALEHAPKDITNAYIARFQPVLEVIAKKVTQFQTDYAAGTFEDNHGAKLATAILDELGGSLTVDSLENIGVSLQADHTFYGMGVYPVIRIGLSDAQVLREAIARIETKMGFEMPEKELNGNAYWRVAENGMPVGIYIAILDQQLAISAFPVQAEDSLLAAFLGQEMPEQSMASTNALAIMNSQKGYTGYGSGIVDLQKLAAEFLDADSDTHTYLGPESNFQFPKLDGVCAVELKSMVAKTPRFTGGTTKLTANEIGMRYELEIENSLALNLASLVSDTPTAVDGDHLLSGSLAIQVGKLRSFVLDKVNAVVATPYECEMLQELNRNATQMVEQLNIPMPPMVNNLMGARIMVDDFDPAADLTAGSGLVAIHVDKPEMFVGMASMLLPGFDELDLANQSEPVKIPAGLLRMENLEVFALMGNSAIGASIGGQESKELAAFMDAEPQDNGTFFSVSYDLAKQAEIQALMASDGAAADDISEAFKQSYVSMLGRSRVDASFTDSGLVIDSSISFN